MSVAEWLPLVGLGAVVVALAVERWMCAAAISLAKDNLRNAQYWRAAYELLVEQTGRDVNDGFGVDPRKAALLANTAYRTKGNGE